MKLSGKKKTIIICSVAAALVAVTLTLALVFGLKRSDGTEGVWYCDNGDAEYILTLNNGRYTLVANSVLDGEYTLDDGVLQLDCGIAGTLSDIITLTFEDGEYTFLPRKTVTVTFVSDETETRSVLYGRTVDEPLAVRDGYYFAGWYEGGAPYDFSLPVTRDITLTAMWQKKGKEFAVTLECGFGTEHIVTKGGRVDLPQIEWVGHTFCGWWLSDYDDANRLTRKFGGEVLTEDTTIFALWDTPRSVSVDGDTISWDGGEATVTITGEGLMRQRKANGIFEFPFELCPAGDYTIEVAGETTCYAYRKNKVLGKPSRLEVIDRVLCFDEVEGADGYLIDVLCGNDAHKHSPMDIGKSTHFNFVNCPMREGGIVLTVTAYARGRMSSSNTVIFDARLPVLEVVDAGDETLRWTYVEGASYEVTVLCGESETRFETTDTSFCYKHLSGKLTVSVEPVRRGYLSTPTAVTIDKVSLAAPRVRLEGTVAIWEPVEGADGYTVFADGESYFTSETQFEVPSGAETIAVRADGAHNSLPSELRLGKSLEPVYYGGTLSWNYVLGAQWYEVKTSEVVRTNFNFAEVELGSAGENEIFVRASNGDWEKVVVFAHTVLLNSLGGTGAGKLFKAVGDEISLPMSTKEGYEFGGWYSCPDGGAGNGRLYDDKRFREAGSIALYAYWVPKTYNVVCGDVTEKVTFNGEFVLPVPQSDYKLFDGWFVGDVRLTDECGIGVTPWNIAADVVAVAKWVDILTFTDMGEALEVSGGEGLSRVNSVVVPQRVDGKSVTEVADYAFAGSALSVIELPATITKIGVDAFYDCRELCAINIASGGQFRSEDGVLIDIAGGKFFYPAARKGEFTVPQEVERIAPKQFAGASVERVTVTAGVKAIGEYAFFNCKSLTCVSFEDGEPLEIGVGAFLGCSALELMLPRRTLPFDPTETFDGAVVEADGGNFASRDGALYSADFGELLYFCGRGGSFVADVRRIASGAFEGCNLDEVVISGATIEPNAFARSAIKRVTIVGGSVGDGAFSDCFDLAEVNLTGVTSIGEHAFENCAISELSLPASLTYVGEYAFAGCMSLNGVVISGSPDISELAFFGCHVSAAVVPSAAYKLFDGAKLVVNDGGKSVDGALYSLDMTKLLYHPGGEDITLPDTVTEIGDEVFRGHTELRRIVGKNVTRVHKSAFEGCTSLTSALLSDGLCAGERAFFGCVDLTIDFDLASVDEYAFAGAKCGSASAGGLSPHCFEGAELGSLKISGDIPDFAFANSSVEAVSVSVDASIIGQNAFVYSRLSEIVFEEGDTPLEIGDGAFKFCPLAEIVLPKRTDTVGDGVFDGCAKLSKIDFLGLNVLGSLSDVSAAVTLPNSFARLGTAFAGSKITSINIPSAVTEIEVSAFENCALTSIIIPETVTKIGQNAFAGCAHLSEVTFEGETTICDKAFWGCALTSVDICRATVEGIPFGGEKFEEYRATGSTLYTARDGVLYDKAVTKLIACPTALTAVNLPSTVVEIGDHACAFGALETISALPKRIDRYAFADSKLYRADLSTTEEIGVSAFDGCPLGDIDLAASKNIGAYAFRGTSVTEINIPDGCVVGVAAFANCASLVSASVGGYLPSNLFAGCTSLKSVEWERVTGIGDRAFADTAVTEVSAALDYIGMAAFDGGKLQSIEVKGDCAELADALGGCPELAHIQVVGSTLFETHDGILYDKAGTLLLCPPAKSGEADIPSGTTHIAKAAFFGSALTSIKLPQTLKEIGESAFEGSSIKEVDFGSGTIPLVVGAKAFARSALKYIDINGRVSQLGRGAFEGCEQLVEANFEGKQNISADLFSGCVSLVSVKLPGGITEIGDGAFRASGLASIVIPSSVTRLGVEKDECFASCKSLESVTFEADSRLTSIGDGAFDHSGVKNITVPSGVREIGAYAFRGCSAEIIFESGVDKLNIGVGAFCNATVDMTLPRRTAAIGDSAFEGAKGNIIWNDIEPERIGDRAFFGASLAEVTLSDATTEIGEYAFSCNTGLEKATVSGDISPHMFEGCPLLNEVKFLFAERIAESAFEGCISLGEVALPSSLAYIGDRAFKGSGLKRITIPRGVRYVGDHAFDCDLEDADICLGVEHIGKDAFGKITPRLPGSVNFLHSSATFAADNTTFIEVCGAIYSADMHTLVDATKSSGKFVVPSCVRFVSEGAFAGSEVTSVTLPRITEIPQSAFEGCAALAEVIMPDTVRRIGAFAFRGCTALKGLSLSDGITSIGAFAFNESGIEQISLPDTVRELGANVFDGSALCKAKMPKNLTQVPVYAFRGTPLTQIDLPQTVSEIGAGAFEMTALERLDLAGVTLIGDNAFRGSLLMSVNLPSATQIGVSAFENCASLSVANVGRAQIIGSRAFNGCAALRSIDLGSVTSIGSRAFENCTALDLVVPMSAAYVGEGAFCGWTSSQKLVIEGSVASWDEEWLNGCDAK